MTGRSGWVTLKKFFLELNDDRTGQGGRRVNECHDLLLHGQKLKRAYDGMFRAVMADHGLTRNEVDVLLFLANNPGHDTAGELVELRGLAKSQVCRSVEALQARGLLVGRQDPKDRRRVHLALTGSAAAPVREAQAAQRLFLDLLYQGVTAEERVILARVFGRIERNIREVLGHAD